jgi:integrase
MQKLEVDNLEAAIARAAELDAEIKPKPNALPTSIFDGLCASYLDSSGFRQLAPKSQALNRLYVGKLGKRFGGLEVVGITRTVVVAFREKLSKEIEAAPKREPGKKKPRLLKGQESEMTPNVAKHLVNKLSLLMSHAVDLGIIPLNPAARAKANFGVKSRKVVWEPGHVTTILKAAPPKLLHAAGLLHYTAQRPADVMAMQRDQVIYREGKMWLSLRQQKTGELVEVPAHRDLAAILEASPIKEGLLVPSPRDGKPWSYRNFCRAWDAAMEKAGLADLGLQRRDLRRTAMVRMAEAGATDTQIAGVSGHSIEQTRRILDTYIPRRGEVAAGAISAWERMDDRQKAQLKPVL